jgi:hypothetical protein
MGDLEDLLDEFDDGGFDRPQGLGPRRRVEERPDKALQSVRLTRRRMQSPTHCAHGHEWTEQNTYWLRGYRQCRICTNEHRRVWNQKHRPVLVSYRKRKDLPVYWLSLPG